MKPIETEEENEQNDLPTWPLTPELLRVAGIETDEDWNALEPIIPPQIEED